MLVHAWDAATSDGEWRAWLADGHDFGLLAASDPGGRWPVVSPVHFAYDGDREVLIHLARSNPIWPVLERTPFALLSVVDDDAFIPGTWRAGDGVAPEHGVPTSYYAAVQLSCAAEILDDPGGKAALLARQLAHFQPEGDHAPVLPGQPPYGPMLSSIRGMRLTVERVTAKFKYDDQKTPEFRERVAARLAARSRPRDAQARAQQLRRLAATESPEAGGR